MNQTMSIQLEWRTETILQKVEGWMTDKKKVKANADLSSEKGRWEKVGDTFDSSCIECIVFI